MQLFALTSNFKCMSFICCIHLMKYVNTFIKFVIYIIINILTQYTQFIMSYMNIAVTIIILVPNLLFIIKK